MKLLQKTLISLAYSLCLAQQVQATLDVDKGHSLPLVSPHRPFGIRVEEPFGAFRPKDVAPGFFGMQMNGVAATVDKRGFVHWGSQPLAPPKETLSLCYQTPDLPNGNNQGPVLYASSSDASIKSAISTANSYGGGSVIIPFAKTTMSSACTVYKNVHLLGYGVTPTFTGTVPDFQISGLGSGSILIGNGSFDCFKGQDVDNTVSPYLTNVEISGIGFSNFHRALSIGAIDSNGTNYSAIHDLIAYNCQDWSFWLINCTHTRIARLWSLYGVNGQVMFGSYANTSTTFFGNETIDNIYGVIPPSTAGNINSRGIVFECSGVGSNGNMNEVEAERIQMNRLNETTTSQTATFTAGPTCTVTDGTKFIVGQPCWFTTGSGNLQAKIVITVASVSGNVLNFKTQRSASSNITLPTSGTLTLQSDGEPGIEVECPVSGGPAISSSTFKGLDYEGNSSAGLYVDRVNGGEFTVNEAPRNSTGADIVQRNSDGNKFFLGAGNGGSIVDCDSHNGNTYLLCPETLKFFNNLPTGQWGMYDATSGQAFMSWNLQANSGLKPDLLTAYFAGNWINVQRLFGQFLSNSNSTSGGFDASHAGMYTVNLTSVWTRNLPIINTTQGSADCQPGWWVKIYNINTGTGTLSTQSSQKINSTGGTKTSYAIPAASVTFVLANIDVGGTVHYVIDPPQTLLQVFVQEYDLMGVNVFGDDQLMYAMATVERNKEIAAWNNFAYWH